MSKKLSRELIIQKVKSDRIESIKNLNLWGSNIEDISIIYEMPSLEIVSLSLNKIKTLRPFAHLANLRELYLRRNLISNLNEIKYLTDCQNLSVLWLSENPICKNPNYRAIVICVLPQLQKLDDIAITDKERDIAERKLRGNFQENDDVDDEEEPEEKNYLQRKEKVYDNNDDNYYRNHGRQSQNKRSLSQKSNKYDERNNEQDEYIKPKKNYPQTKSRKNESLGRDDRYNYEDRENNINYGKNNKNNNYRDNNKYRESNKENNYKENKIGNSNILNCVINLLKELSPNELKIVKKEIDKMNNY